MPDTGWVLAGTGSNYDNGASTSWSNSANITADDGSNATASPGTFKQTQKLMGTNFGFSIGASSAILGIEARFQLSRGAAEATSYDVYLTTSGTTGTGTAKTGTFSVTTTPTDFDLGGAADMWGTTLTSSDVNSTNFGVGISIEEDGSFSCDAIWVKVTWAHPNLDPPLYTNTSTIPTPAVSGDDALVKVSFAQFYGQQGNPVGGDFVYPDPFTNTTTEYTPTVTFFNDLTPALFTSTNSEYTAAVTATYEVTVPLTTNTSSLFDSIVGSVFGLSAGLFTNTDEIFTHSVDSTYAITVPLTTSTNTEYTAVVASTYDVTPGIFTGANVINDITTALGAIDLTPELYDSPEAINTHTVTNVYSLVGPLTTNTSTIDYDHTVDIFYSVEPGLYDNTPSLFDPFVAREGISLSLDEVYENSPTIHIPNVGVVVVVGANYENTSIIFQPSVQFAQGIDVATLVNSGTIPTHIVEQQGPDRITYVLYYARKLT